MLNKRLVGVFIEGRLATLALLLSLLFCAYTSVHAQESELITVLIEQKPLFNGQAKNKQSGEDVSIQRNRLRNQLNQKQINMVREFNHFPIIEARVTQQQLNALKLDPSVIVHNNELRTPQLASSIPLIFPTQNSSEYDGDNKWAVAVLDSGIDSSHSFLSGKVVSQACFSTTRESAYATSLCPDGPDADDLPDASSTAVGSGEACSSLVAGCDHGTKMAGIIAGSGSNFDGVARQARLISIQVYSRIEDEILCFPHLVCLGAFPTDIIAALDHVMSLRNQFSIASVNLSLGFLSDNSIPGTCNDQPEATPISALKSAGIAVVVPSGNDGLSSSMRIPACVGDAIAVASSDDQDNVDSQSNISNVLDLFAPGVNVESSVPGNGFQISSGTSIAAAHVAGAWAVFKDKSPSASVNQIEAAIKSHGPQLMASGNLRRRIDVSATLESLPEQQDELCFPIVAQNPTRVAVVCL